MVRLEKHSMPTINVQHTNMFKKTEFRIHSETAAPCTCAHVYLSDVCGTQRRFAELRLLKLIKWTVKLVLK